MQTAVRQGIGTQKYRYSQPIKTEAEKIENGKEVLTEKEKKMREIAFLTQYMEDLKAGRPVDNISPSNDPYFLVPENIAGMIRGIKDILAGKGRVLNLDDIWEGI